MNIISSSILDPLREYFIPSTDYYTTNKHSIGLNDILKLRLVCKQFDEYIKEILLSNGCAFTMSRIERLFIPQNVLNYVRKCYMNFDIPENFDCKNIIGDKFIKSNITSYSFHGIGYMPKDFLKHFQGAETYSILHCKFTDDCFEYLRGAKKYTINWCTQLTCEVGKYIRGAEAYTIQGMGKELSLLFKYIGGAKEYKLDIFDCIINENIKYIAGAEKYTIWSHSSYNSNENLKYISGAKEYEFENCQFKQGDLLHLKGAQKYEFNFCKFGIKNFEYWSGAEILLEN